MTQKKYSQYNQAILDLYNVDLEDQKVCPHFGNTVQFELSVSAKDEPEFVETKKNGKKKTEIKGRSKAILPPTYYNLIMHLGLLDWTDSNRLYLERKSGGRITKADIDARFYEAAQEKARKDLSDKFVKPLRRLLDEYDLYFYAIPGLKVDLNAEGEPIFIAGDEVLCVLPKSVKTAKRYGLTDEQIQLLAPQVMWLVKNLCAMKVITTKHDLETALDGWKDYTNFLVQNHITLMIEEARPDFKEEQ